MIKNIVFDMGGVVIRFDRDLFIDRSGVSREDGELLMREVFRAREWVQMDRGTLTDEQACKIFYSRTPERLHGVVRELVLGWDKPVLPIPGVEELIKELKEKGYMVYLLSNASYRQHEYWPKVPAAKYFDGTFVSADVHLIKPQPEIYRMFWDSFGLKGEECVFIDDVPMNIEGAYFAGMDGFVFNEDVSALRCWLRDKGVSVAE